jgi:hypothetical protein
VEFAIGAASMYIPNFGSLGISSKFKISAAVPSEPSVVLSFDFTYSKATKFNASTETVSLAVPSVTAEWQLGSAWGPLRRRQLLGGIFLGGGIAPASFDRSLTGGVGRVSVRSWIGAFDAGWRYRLPKVVGPYCFVSRRRAVRELCSAAISTVPGTSHGVFVILK